MVFLQRTVNFWSVAGRQRMLSSRTRIAVGRVIVDGNAVQMIIMMQAQFKQGRGGTVIKEFIEFLLQEIQ
jgi:hypothetical protein